MNVIEENKNVKQDIYPMVKLLKWSNKMPILIGTASLKSQRYPSDIDLNDFQMYPSRSQMYKKLKNILSKTGQNDNMYLIEIKIQCKVHPDMKVKFYDDKFTKKEFMDSIKPLETIDYIKIDYVIRVLNKFIELSVNYYFDGEKMTNNQIDNKVIDSLNIDARNLIDEGNYYKALKRFFGIFKQVKDKKMLVKLSKFFNSENGQKYQIVSNLKAIKLLLENYDDDITKKKVILNLKDLHIPPNIDDIDNIISDLEKQYNKNAKKIYDKYFS